MMENENNETETKIEAPKPKKNIKLPVIIGSSVAAVALIVAGIIVWPKFAEKYLISSEEREQINTVISEIDALEPVTTDSLEAIQAADGDYQSLSEKCQAKVTNFENISTAYAEYDQACADVVINAITDLSPVTTESLDAISAAEAKYDALTADQQALVTNYADIAASYEAYDQACADEVSEMIDALDPTADGGPEAIEAAEEAYGALTEDQQALVSNYDGIQTAYDSYYGVLIQNCIDLIDAMPDSGEITLENHAAMDAASDAYNAIPLHYQSQVTNYSALADAILQYQDLVEAQEREESTIDVGESYSNSPFAFTLQSARITSTILPDDTSGYYQYLNAKDGKVFVDLVFNIRNNSLGDCAYYDFVQRFSVQYGDGETETSHSMVMSYGFYMDNVYSWEVLEDDESATIHIISSVPESVANDGQPVTVTLKIDNRTFYVNVR